MSTHTNINMSTAASNFAADLNSEPISFPSTDTSIKKSVPFVPLNEKWLLTIPEAAAYFGVGQNRISELPCRMAASLLYSWATQNVSNGKSLRSFWTSKYAI